MENLKAESNISTWEKRHERQLNRRRWLLSSPALLLILVAASGPLLIVVVYSFLTPVDFGGVVWEFSFEGWKSVLFQKDIFTGEVSWSDAHLSILWRSVSLAFFTTCLTMFFGVCTAYYMVTLPPAMRHLFIFLITIPFWTSLLIRTLAMLEVIRNEGLINTALIMTGIIDQPIQMLYTDFAVLMGMVYVFLPLMVMPVYSSLEKFDFRLVEAGYDLYASRWQVFRKVIIPLVRPGIVAGSILVFVPSLGAYVTPRILGGGKSWLLGNLIEHQFGPGRNWPVGSALSLFLLFITMVALYFYTKSQDKVRRKE